MLAELACAEESKDGWMEVLQDLRTRGATQMDLMVTDGHDGLLATFAALFTATPSQRCVVHKHRNVMNALPKREQQTLATELAGIWKSPTKEEALTQLAAFKGKYQKLYPEAERSLMEYGGPRCQGLRHLPCKKLISRNLKNFDLLWKGTLKERQFPISSSCTEDDGEPNF